MTYNDPSSIPRGSLIASKNQSKKCTRNRSGCLICKKRKKKCGEEKPSCSNCVRLNLSCSYAKVLLWHTSNQQNLKTHRSICKTPNQRHFLVTTASDISLSTFFCNGEAHNNNAFVQKGMNFEKTETVGQGQFLAFSSNSGVESDLFEYYISNLSKRKAFSDCSQNEFRSLIVPNCYNSPALFQSVIALAANDMVRTKPELSEYYSSLSAKYKNEAINILHNVLDTEPQFINSDSSELLNEMIITILMLCSLEISDKGNKSWLNHLKEGGLIFGSLTYSKILSSGMLLFAYRYFTLRYILLITTLNQAELERFMSFCSWPIIEKYFDSDKIDYMLGCSPKLLFIIYKTTVLAHERHKLSDEQFARQASDLEELLFSLKQVLNNPSTNGLLLCSQAYYESAKIFFYSTLKIGNSDEHIYASLHRSIDILMEFSSFSENKTLSLAPAWSLFIGCTCAGSLMNDQVRAALLDIFENLEKFWPLASLYPIKRAVETIWKVNDLAFAEDVTKIDKPPKADWRDILSIRGYKLALT